MGSLRERYHAHDQLSIGVGRRLAGESACPTKQLRISFRDPLFPGASRSRVRAIEAQTKRRTTMKKNLLFATLFTASLAMAQVMIPDGTKIRVRLEENL